MNIIIVEKTRCRRLNAGLAKNFWEKAMNITCFVLLTYHLGQH
jgi:hypothetical protein